MSAAGMPHAGPIIEWHSSRCSSVLGRNKIWVHKTQRRLAHSAAKPPGAPLWWGVKGSAADNNAILLR
eukprot:2991836-Amphidinium_carterae.2